jgi:hypothetical protein
VGEIITDRGKPEVLEEKSIPLSIHPAQISTFTVLGSKQSLRDVIPAANCPSLDAAFNIKFNQNCISGLGRTAQ